MTKITHWLMPMVVRFGSVALGRDLLPNRLEKIDNLGRRSKCLIGGVSHTGQKKA